VALCQMLATGAAREGLTMAKRATPAPQHNYLRKLRYLMRVGALPHTVGLHQLTVYHDDWCGIYQDKRCSCNPDIRLAGSPPDAAKH
jgi:hypothetical protein